MNRLRRHEATRQQSSVFWGVVLSWLLALPSLVSMAAGEDAKSPAVSGARKGPVARFTPTSLSIGRIAQNAFASRTVTIWNDGDQVLKIGRIESSCGCAAAVPAMRDVPPGKSVPLHVVFRSGKMTGLVEKVILVHTNDPRHASVEIPISGLVVAPLVADLEEILFPLISPGQEVDARYFTILADEGRDISIARVRTSCSALKISRKRIARRGHVGYEFTVKLDTRKLRPGPFQEEILVETEKPEKRAIRIRVLANVTGPIRVSPRLFSFGLVRKGKGATRKIRVEKTSDGAFSIRNISTTCSWLDTTTKEIEPGKVYEVEIRVPPSAPKGRIACKLTIETDDPEQPELKVSVYGVVR